MARPIVTFMPVAQVSSPCINVCSIDAHSGLCEGCSRTLDEIARWTTMSLAERTRVLAELKDR